MGVSEDRIDELLEDMIKNADKNGWCHVPDGLSDDEQDELSRRLIIITMQERIDVIREGILTVIKYMEDILKFMSEYDTMEKLTIKSGIETIKEDAQGLLMDLHGDDVIGDFFRITMIDGENDGENDTDKEEAAKAKGEMEKLLETDFKEQLEEIKSYCTTMIEISDDVGLMLEK